MAKILLMEDDLEFAFQVKNDLLTAGHEVEVRYSATAALEELADTSYDLLISDIVVFSGNTAVPDGGIKLIGTVRRNPKTRQLPILAITGSHQYTGMQYILVTAKQVGADVCLEKPFMLQELLDIVTQMTNPMQNASIPEIPS